MVSDYDKRFSLSRSFMVASVNRDRVFLDILLDKDIYNAGETALINVFTSILDSTAQQKGELTIAAVLNKERYEIVELFVFDYIQFSETIETNHSVSANFTIPSIAELRSSIIEVSLSMNDDKTTRTKLLPISTAEKVAVFVYPEGGFLGCALENRFYFQALDGFNKSINVEGRVVDSANQIVANVISGVDGRGKSELFSVSPKQTYFFEITSPIQLAGQKTKLPA